MASMVTIDLRQIARSLNIPLRQVEATVELLDGGNTVPFITRYRKDQTGGLDEEQIRLIQDSLIKSRLLAERKQTILRSIESQGKLTEKLSKQILSAQTTKWLEDLYLPFKPKKQTLATNARNRGLEGLAQEIIDANPLCADLDARAKDYANPDKQVPTAADALLGAGHIIAEQFSEHAELRHKLREIMQRTGVIITTRLAPEITHTDEKPKKVGREALSAATTIAAEVQPSDSVHTPLVENPASSDVAEPIVTALSDTHIHEDAHPLNAPAIQAVETNQPIHAADSATAPAPLSADAASSPETISSEDASPPHAAHSSVSVSASNQVVSNVDSIVTADHADADISGGHIAVAHGLPEQKPMDSVASETVVLSPEANLPTESTIDPKASMMSDAQRKQLAKRKAKEIQAAKREKEKKNLEAKRIKAFSDYFDYREEIKKIPPHRILAINRGEKAKVIRVKIEMDLQAMVTAMEEALVPPNHPHADYLRGCARDALSRLILASLDRETRREMTDRAEAHAVSVFAKNLRNLLLFQPVHNHRVLALDPGFKSGCKLAALDQFGNLLEHAVICLVGKQEIREAARKTVVDLIKKYQLTVVAIGNGTACRETEKFVSDILGNDLKDQGIAYVIVNEAGASVYSTSRLGREEFPDYDATLRGAISIGRRLQDPLSELVKIDPANIGVGLYQHDVKAKYLKTTLDEVVESCVNYVGVDVNTASPALLRYVSGLNQLTAHRLYEYRRDKGPFRNREQLRQVPGLGDATFVQAAGFLKISAGDNPLDTTWIHPESYAVANRILEKIQCTPNDLTDKTATAALGEQVSKLDLEAMAKELEVGALSLKDILAQLVRPGRDPREDLPPPIFKHGIIKLEDLAPGMELRGSVLNVVDFGCFVDIGIHDTGLVHVSHMANRFIRDPHEIVSVGDIVKVWVLEIEKERRRVSLTLIPPGTEKPPRPPRHGHKPAQGEHVDGQHPAPNADGSRAEDATDQRQQNRNRSRRESGQQNRGQRREGQRPSGGRPDQRRNRPPRSGQYTPHMPKPKPKPFVPITEAMKEGKEPMRTFGDLLQYFGDKSGKSDDSQKKDGHQPKPKKTGNKTDSSAVAAKVDKKPENPIEVMNEEQTISTQKPAEDSGISNMPPESE